MSVIIDKTSFILPKQNYFQEECTKDCVVLHFTGGLSANSAYQTWIRPDGRGKPQHVATPYVVGPGVKPSDPFKIYEFFDPKYWAYHLAMPSNNYNWPNDRRTIPIEIVNPGQLVTDKNNPNQLNWWPGNFTAKWCTLQDTNLYTKIPSYRGYTYFATFPTIQIQLVKDLVKDITDRFNIPKNTPVQKKYDFDGAFFSGYKGVASHVNFNPGKLDLNPSCESWYNDSLFS